MTPKKILITGLGAAASEAGIRALLGRFGPVGQVELICDGSAEHPVALVEMSLGDGAAAYLVSRLTDYWHDGRLVNARLLHH